MFRYEQKSVGDRETDVHKSVAFTVSTTMNTAKYVGCSEPVIL